MEDLIYTLATSGSDVLAWLGGLLVSALIWGTKRLVDNSTAREYIIRAIGEITDAVSEVAQKWVDDLKAARADGKLTDQEKSDAWREALSVAKSNIGRKGIDRLMGILGYETETEIEEWIGTKIEASVDGRKRAKQPTPKSKRTTGGGKKTARPLP